MLWVGRLACRNAKRRIAMSQRAAAALDMRPFHAIHIEEATREGAQPVERNPVRVLHPEAHLLVTLGRGLGPIPFKVIGGTRLDCDNTTLCPCERRIILRGA